ncbi:tRNA pseudouridine(38-40) synthase TruA [Leptotrichia sp. oral taxon 223]|uniref:tRNA pseudouridine(38-40) synthase TruA n=1 Tax=Leptotrichia sp. oral taxon 223 TaxID=712363 RepID=UPI0015BD3769|nr:tRNA pseudouridine(38-40) synthase TruA [Leptotrichia sp. oral taxon 223]NWO18810.1 tRNA pseudouridine(38-40) synthase TruA [Leptotrichia sp. oral taxon 223]
MEKRNVKMIYQYDGSKFCGFQRQNTMKTVQGEIEKVIFRTFSQKINMISSGRTDKGVHAMEQVSNFLIDKNIPLEAIKRQINKCLKGEVKVLGIEEADGKFNARFDAKSRTYLYIMRTEEDITPFEVNYVTGLRKNVDAEKFQEIMNDFVGKYDFSSFMKKDKAYRNPVREIFYIKCYYDEKFGEKQVNVEICGNGFLKTMVRIMIGSALAVYFGNEGKDCIRKKLANPNADGKKILAASEGLYLYKVNY